MKGTLILSALLFLVFTSSFAQKNYTKLSGKIVDAKNGNPLAGATIVLENGKGVNTDVEGNYFLQVEEGKKYTLKVTNVGYQSKLIKEVQVTAAANPVINISLERSSGELSNVVVTATSARRESVNSLYAAQKNSSAISDGISAEVIKKSPDKNTGEVLKRVSGASVQDNKFVVIRGLNERYNESLLNNTILPSTEPDKKAFSFDIIPSALVDNIVVYKTATPDLPGDFSGGAVKVSTKDYPVRSLSELSVSVGYNSLTTFKNFYKSVPEGNLDGLGILGSSRLMPGTYARHRGAAFVTLSDDFRRNVTKQFPNSFGYEAAYKSQPNIGFSYTGGNTTILENSRKLGFIYSVNYSTGRKVSERERDEYLIGKLFQYNYNTTNYDIKNNVSALLNLSYSYNRSKISLKNIFNNDFTKTVGLRNGYDASNAPDVYYYKSANGEATQNGIVNSVLEGLHRLKNSWTIDWNGSFGATYRWQPDQHILTFRTDYNNHTDYYLRLPSQNSPDVRIAGRVYSFLNEYIYGTNGNATKQFQWLGETQKIKFGTANYYRTRSVQVDALGYSYLKSYSPIYESKNASLTNLSDETIDDYNLALANIGTNSTDYTGTAMLNAGYAMLDNKFSDKIKLTWGVRAEKYRQNLQAKNQPDVIKDDIDVLPSFLFTYAVTNRANFRVAASKAVNRPEFRELAPYSVYDYENYFVVRGNPNLERSKNTNADLRYEWFPASGEIISASIFYKNFKNPIEQVNKGNDVLSYENADKAVAYGIELEVRKKLDFINGAFFKNLTFYTNAALIDGYVKIKDFKSNNPLQGQSPYLINGGLTYANNNFSVNVLFNKIGPRLKYRASAGVNQSIYERSRDVLDFQISKKFLNNKLELKLTVSDLFAQPYSWYYKFDSGSNSNKYNPSQDVVINSIKYGTSASIGLKYNFGK